MTIDEREQDERHGRDGGVKQSQSPHPRREAISEERCQSSRGKTFTTSRAERSYVKIMKFDHIVETTAPPEKIWAAWTDVQRWPQ